MKRTDGAPSFLLLPSRIGDGVGWLCQIDLVWNEGVERDRGLTRREDARSCGMEKRRKPRQEQKQILPFAKDDKPERFAKGVGGALGKL